MLGVQLRQARERRGFSLDKISRDTKIPIRILAAIDSEDFRGVPDGLVRRGFLRAYAKAIGQDPEETVHRYRAEFDPPASPDQDEASAVEAPSDEVTALDLDNAEPRSLRRQWLGSAVVVAVGTLVYVLLARHTNSPAVELAPPAAESLADVQQVATSGSGDTVTGGAASRPWTRALHVEIQPGGPCWIMATSDGRQAIQRLMNPGDREILEANNEATLRMGDAVACAFSINGAAAIPPAPAGHPVTFRITKENYQQFVYRAAGSQAFQERPALAIVPASNRAIPVQTAPAPISTPAAELSSPSTLPAPIAEAIDTPGTPSPGPEPGAIPVSAIEPLFRVEP